MNDSLGPFGKIIIAILVVLFGIYYSLDHYYPTVFYPELNKVAQDPASSLKAEPRKGVVVPVSGYSAYLSNAPALQDQSESGEIQGSGASYDPTKIHLFRKGMDGVPHPVSSYLIGFVPFETNQYWLPLLAVSLRIRYMRDDMFIPNAESWQTSLQTYIRRWGDCKDHAILLADWLIGLGYDARVQVGTIYGQGHAWVVLYKDGKEYLLESTDKSDRRRYPLVALHPEYVPVAMFNRDHYWSLVTDNRGWNNSLSTKNWVILSDFKNDY
jgi:hypothetical protein